MKYLLIIVILTIAGCASHGNKIDAENVSKIEKGVTTESEVFEKLGRPISITRNSDGTKTFMYVYVYSETKASTFIPIVGMFTGGVNTETQSLIVVIENGVVKDWSLTESSSQTNTGLTST